MDKKRIIRRNNTTYKKCVRCFISVVFIMSIFFSISKGVSASDNAIFNGNGTKENPYKIENKNDLILFRDLVNKGESFRDKYFLQTEDINLIKEKWQPIGKDYDKTLFEGTYDGNGHIVENMNVATDSYGGLFGVLAGTVANLGIESGSVEGSISGGIVGASSGEDTAIINCYSKADVSGEWAGGIAGSLKEGILVMSWSDSEISGNVIGGILADGGDVKIYGCYTTSEIAFPSNIGSLTSYSIKSSDLYSPDNILKFNLKTGLAQVLFANNLGIDLKSWEISDTRGISFCDNVTIIRIFQFFDQYLLTIVYLIIVIIIFIKLHNLNLDQIWCNYQKQIQTLAVILFVIALFLDTALISKGLSILNPGNASFIVLINFSFLLLTLVTIKHLKWKSIQVQKRYLPLFFLILLAILLELLQFNLVPKYDASLYYGSFIKGAELYNLNLFSYIGSFVCWKWIQGLALFLSPFEFLFPGSMVSVYIANVFITIITLIILYFLLRSFFRNMTSLLATIICAVFLVLPYGLGLFTYLCMDWHLPFFTIWLLYGIKTKNNIWISFCGYLLAFTKITGLFFYVFILICVAICEVLENKEENIFVNILKWWKWKKVILWVLPAILFCITFFIGDYLTVQNFLGSPYNPSALFDIIDKQRVLNTVTQSFIFGFRWLFVVCFIGGVCKYIIRRRKLSTILTTEGRNIIIALLVSTLLTFSILSILNSDGECPRYTAIFNVTYVFVFPLSLYMIFESTTKRIISSGVVAVVLFIQTYWTIDPSIILLADSMSTGKKNIYKLCVPGDTKPGMNLGEDYAGVQVIGDLYAYNMEYTFYDDLLDQALSSINPTENDTIYVLDIIDYELHTSGSANRNYKIYWDAEKQKRTYNKYSTNSMYLDERSIKTEDICATNIGELDLPDKFYLFVVARIDESKAVERLKEEGYSIISEMNPENLYGSMQVYEFQKKYTK